jgi:hypothetical protein|tara:strand:- start:49 stop:495 length:447 start_codon:yes stop_codon:yes gene_type:complete
MIEESDSIEDAQSQLKRADHLLYVTLKYTRTVDVIKSIIKRFISAFDHSVEEMLEKSKDKKRIKTIPKSPIEKIELIKKIVKTKEMRDYIKFYYLLRTIDKATFKPREEYRKHVTLITPKHEVDVEKVKEFYEKTKEFVGFSHEFKGR